MEASAGLLGSPSLGVFVSLTVVLAGAASVLAGRAIALNWRPARQVVLSSFGLALVDRFLTYALFEGRLLDPFGFLLHFLVILALGLSSWRIVRTGKFVSQYPWRYRRTSPFAYAERPGGTPP